MNEVPSDIESYERLILDSSSLAILQILEGCITYANPEARELFAGDKDAVLDGQVIDGRLVCENVDLKMILDDVLAKNAVGEQKNCMVVDAGGNQLPVQLAIMPLLHQKQGLLRIIVEKLTETSLKTNEKVDSEQQIKPDAVPPEPAIETPKEQKRVKTSSAKSPVIVRKALANAAKGKLVTLLSIRLENHEQLELALGENNIHRIANDIIDKFKSVLGKEVLLENSLPSLFHILVGTQNQAKLKQVADNLSRAMDELVIEVSEQVVQVATAISILPVDKESDAELLQSRIEKTLARAAEKGLNHWHLFDSKEELAELACQGDASALVRYALDNGQFKLLYQPVISLTGDKEEHYAVLLRIVDPSGKEVVAGQFAGEVDRIALGAKMDRWVILQSIKQLVIHRKKVRKKAHLFIHLSSASLQDKTLLPWVLGVLQKIPVGADSLVFQFSEKNAMRYREDIQRLLQGAKKVGFRTSLCDFGLSMKPLKTAEELSTDYVRLDATLTNNMEDDKAQEENVSEMIKALTKLNRKTIAVPVENPNALSAFWRTQVDYVQGFFVQQPKPDMDYDFSMDE
ncbi:EAL domain-containing protein [Kistimonas asteriae]|uniref:EAL domain-containing protein n=1 Tax=Kistimonas asteriae TaxID=517724 RepID=UPI001BAA1ADB|nr:EAL domain-containing protein [Kistimonas asteriae]